MKKIIIPVLLAMSLIACGNQSKTEDSSCCAKDSTSVCADAEGNRNEAGAKAEIENIYNIYFNPGGMANEDEESDFGFMTQFVSEHFRDCYGKAQAKQMALGEVWLDCDPWIDAQDCEDLELVEVKIKECTDEQAVADVTFKNFGENHTVGCVVVYDEKSGKWLVDDLIHPENGSVKQMAIEFCAD